VIAGLARAPDQREVPLVERTHGRHKSDGCPACAQAINLRSQHIECMRGLHGDFPSDTIGGTIPRALAACGAALKPSREWRCNAVVPLFMEGQPG
jgi:hypothetical protein